MKKICIVGNKGNMGRRYKAILDYLQIESQGFDKDDPTGELDFSQFDGFIIASPTHTHLGYLDFLGRFEKPILCEKPLVIGELKDIEKMGLVTMINQYAYLIDKTSTGETHYNYFKTGGDGLAWDCLNICGLAHKRPIIENNSPVWKCTINGQELSLADMDNAYVKMVIDWMRGGTENWTYAKHAHRKVLEWLR